MGTRYNRLGETDLTSTHNLCLRAKIRKNEYPCKPQFYYVKVGLKGVKIARTCYHDELNISVSVSTAGLVKSCKITIFFSLALFAR